MFIDYSEKIRTIKIIKCLTIIYKEFIIHDLIKWFIAAVQVPVWIKISKKWSKYISLEIVCWKSCFLMSITQLVQWETLTWITIYNPYEIEVLDQITLHLFLTDKLSSIFCSMLYLCGFFLKFFHKNKERQKQFSVA